jgi:ABC-type molybdate transport system permease subunit
VGIYSFAETGRDRDAFTLVAISAAIAFAALLASNWITSRPGVRA